jgi:hypothetical protein
MHPTAALDASQKCSIHPGFYFWITIAIKRLFIGTGNCQRCDGRR